MKQITVNGYTYNSISQAWRVEAFVNLPMITVRWRLNNGWNISLAFNMPPIKATERRQFKGVRGE